MENSQALDISVSNFQILFEKLEEASQEQDPSIAEAIKESTSATETIALFREYQDSMVQSSFSTYTMA